MQWFKTEDVVNALQSAGMEVVAENSTTITLRVSDSSSPVVIIKDVPEIPDELLRHVLAQSAGISDAGAFIKSLGLTAGEEVSEEPVDDTRVSTTKSKVWSSTVVKAMLKGQEGTPLDFSELKRDEISVLSEDAKGTWADHPDIKDSVEWIREVREGLSTGIPRD